VVTVRDDFSSEREITLMQRDRSIGHHLAGQPDHPRELGNQLVQLGMESGPHEHHLLFRTGGRQ